MTGLHMAARGGHVLVLARLASLQLGLDINTVDAWGFTPLDQAIATEQWPCATLLLALGGAIPLSCMPHMHIMLRTVIVNATVLGSYVLFKLMMLCRAVSCCSVTFFAGVLQRISLNERVSI
jgi:hypothetical protein